MPGYNPPLIFQTAVDADGNPAPNAKLYHYVTESTILKDLFADFELQTPLPQPLVAGPDGAFQQYFMEPGYYKFVLLDQNNNQLRAPQDHVCGAGAGGTAPEDDHKVLVDETDTTPGYLYEKLEDTTGLFWSISGAPGGVHAVRGEVQPGAGDTYKVKGSVSDSVPGFLEDKIANSNTVDLNIIDDKLQATVTGPFTVKVDSEDAVDEYLHEKLEDTDGIHWEISGVEGGGHHVRGEVQPGAGDTYQAKVNSSDLIPGYLGTKVKAGTGITINTTTDDVDGIVMHINANNQNNGKVKATSTDTTADFLVSKIIAGPGMTVTPVVAGATSLVIAPINTYLEDVRSYSNKLNVGDAYASPQNVCTLTLTAGTWVVEGSATSYIQATTNVGGRLVANIGNSGTLDLDGYDQWAQATMMVGYDNLWSASSSVSIARRRYVVATGATRTIYLVVQQGIGPFTVCQMWGNLTAKKIV